MPSIKSEQLDPELLPPSYYLQQQQQQQNMAPQTNTGLPSNNVQQADKNAAQALAGLETQPDLESIKGVFGWTVIDNVHVPFILRGDKQFVSVRIVEMKLLSRYPNWYPNDLGNHDPLTSFYATANEAKLLNEINVKHCEGEYGKKDFSLKELIVLLSDFIKFYELVKITFPDPNAAREAASRNNTPTSGWLQIKNTVTPYIKRVDGDKYVPLSVIKYAAGLLTNENVSGVVPTSTECELLNEACQKAGVEFVFSETSTKLVQVSHMLQVAPVDIIELPSNNPLKHATYMELPTTSNVQSTERVNSNTAPQQQHTSAATQAQQAQPYLFQPKTQLEIIQAQIEGSVNRVQLEAATRKQQHQPQQQVTSAPRPPHSGSAVFDPMADPKFAAFYRMQFISQNNRAALSKGPPNMNVNPVNSSSANTIGPIMQYYMNVHRQPVPDAAKTNGVPWATQPHPVMINGHGADPVTRRSPGASSNPSPRSRPPCQSPSAPSAARPLSYSPLSPTASLPSPHHPSPYPVGIDAIQRANSQFSFPGNVEVSRASAHTSVVIPSVTVPQASNHVARSMPVLSNVLMTSSVNNMFPDNANQEIPGLYTPIRTGVPSHINAVPGNNAVNVPPPLVLMSSNANMNVSSQPGIISTVNKVVPEKVTRVVQPSPVSVTYVTPNSQTLSEPTEHGDATSQTSAAPCKGHRKSLTDCIKGAWLNNKSISCLFIDNKDHGGQFCLIEAVCKLYFNGCSVKEFLFALEHVLFVPLLTCDKEVEMAFIQYYRLPVAELKCKEMIKFEDLEKYFPQLSYMFPSKEALSQSENDLDQVSDLHGTGLHESSVHPSITNAGFSTDAVMPMSVSDTSKRNSTEQNGRPTKQLRTGSITDDDDDIIILD